MYSESTEYLREARIVESQDNDSIEAAAEKSTIQEDIEAATLAANLNNTLLCLAQAGWKVAFRQGHLVQRGSGLWVADARVVTFARETRRGASRESRLGILVRSPSDMRSPLRAMQPIGDTQHISLPTWAEPMLEALRKACSGNPRPVLHLADGILLDLQNAKISATAWSDKGEKWVEVLIEGAEAEKPSFYLALI